MPRRIGCVASAICTFAVALAAGCQPRRQRDQGRWTAREMFAVEGLSAPESVVVDPASGAAYVSSIVPDLTKEGKARYWSRDGTGFITRLKPGGTLDTLRWVESKPAAPLHTLKGLCVLDGVLYAADFERVVRFDLATGKALEPILIPGAQRLNDMATDGRHPYVSDVAAGRIYRIRSRGHDVIRAPAGANGITFWRGRMFGVSVSLHEIYELDPGGNTEPKRFGLAEHFKTLDGIEVLDDGSFIVSDYLGDRVCWVGKDRKTVRTLATLTTPADIGLDRNRGLLFVPSMKADRVVVFSIEKK